MKYKYLNPADILLPKKDFEKWSVIACDQYTSEPKYWEDVANIVDTSASAYNIILPEVYLSDNDSEKIEKINSVMNDYLNCDVFNTIENSTVYIERTLKNGKIRKGILGLIDLEEYSYESGSRVLIRATEKTVVERIPARVNIRKDAPIEIPHIMLLIDDKENCVFNFIEKNKQNLQKIYDFKLMQNAGSIKGYKLTENEISDINDLLDNIKNSSDDGMLFAVGDGNHSLAAAKECYKLGKGSRYALAEIVNIHDTSLEFEPIYRIAIGEEPEKLISEFINFCGGEYNENDAQVFTCVYNGLSKNIYVKGKGTLCVATLQEFLDQYIKIHNNFSIDYIHGIQSVTELSKKEMSVGFIFNGMEKDELFTAVTNDGSLPRKTFSMGCADDKRFYLEARKL